jgi:hypothetical protein
VADRRYNAKLILPDGTEKPSLIVYFPPTLTGEEVEDIGREILAVFSGTLCSDVEDEEGRGTTTEDMLDAGLLDADGVPEGHASARNFPGADDVAGVAPVEAPSTKPCPECSGGNPGLLDDGSGGFSTCDECGGTGTVGVEEEDRG